MTPPFNRPSFSSGTIPSYDNYLLDLQSHILPYRSPRPLTLPSWLPAPALKKLVLLVDRGLNQRLGALPRDHLTSILRTVILSLSEGQRQAYYRPNDTVEGTVQEEEEDRGPPLPRVEPRSPRPASVTCSIQKDSWGLLLLDGRYSRRDQRPSSTVDGGVKQGAS